MLRKLIHICLIFFFSVAHGQTLIFKNFSVNHGLASSTVYSILQDSKGFIWFATENGVNRFDGKNFELFTIDNGLSDNEVLQISEDSKGRIWFLTLNGKLSYYLNKRFYNTVTDPLLRKTISTASFTSFYEDSHHRLWFSTNQKKVLLIDGENAKFYSSQYSFSGISLFEDPEGTLFGITKGQLLKLVNEKFIKVPIAEIPLSAKALSYNKTTRSLKYISETGLIGLKNRYTNVLRYFPENINPGSIGKFIYDNQNNLWLTTMGDGLYFFKSNGSSAEHYLKDNLISDIKQDQQGNIWISTIGNGVYMLPFYSQFSTNYTTADGLSSNSVQSVIKMNNKILLGLRSGKIDVVSNSKITSYLEEKEYNPIKKLFHDKKNNSIWFASDNELGELDIKTRKTSTLQEICGGSYALKSFSINNQNKVALALASGVYEINKQKPLVFDSKKALYNNPQFGTRSFTVYYDSFNRLWIANINGLFCYYENKILYQNREIRSQRITDITELPDKSIACTTVGFGVLIIKDLKKQITITKRDGLPSNICKKILIKDREAWVVTGKGISRINLNNGISIKNYSTENGLITTEINDLYVEGDSIYAATNSGLSIINVNTFPYDKDLPPLYLTQFLSNKKAQKVNKDLRIPYKGNNITVNYIALDFEHPQSVKYSYRLNRDLKWSETSANTLEFASLQPGSYDLQIRSKCLNSKWSEPIQVRFKIEPPFWRTWWFIVLLLSSLALLLFFAISRYYKFKRKKEHERLLTQTRIISLEQQALQAMMNPHFVFNVMNSIQYFINTKDNAMANQALTGFARLLRKNLENCNKSYITLEEEVSYLTLYLSLEKMRFGERMNYKINIDPGINKESTLIPSMLLQPYVENAIWHGLMPKDADGNLLINISLYAPSNLQIEIIDDGIGIENSLNDKPEGHISRGMQLTKERINLLNKFKNRSISVEVKQLHPEGTCVRLQIPF
ncbi:ligand-binding sensor domain-containing protein [Desertivirga brevis]|uniref:ligand-binding sensor domain-containing protein n=1 Tax=Desertivirga brevis TaxID=2810310 RepID=UPI001A972959|nr:two-component regulator propeller domain-containing protein [Pedobacter sp. SYSU D00873]